MDPDIRRALVKALTIAAAVLALLGVGGWGAVTAGDGLGYATGLSGTPGVLVADRCLRTDSAEAVPTETGDCRGTFYPDGGGLPNEYARIDWKVDTHNRVRVSCEDGECRLAGTAGLFKWLSLFLFALAAITLGACLAARLLKSLIPWKWLVTALAITTGALLTGAFAFLLGGLAAG
ncbi:hypothetical protein ACIF6L_21160 [Kitasatospora sp. NPDC086009]|uniref:hypothetical protein n=1 Tax=unclassified Kitasatospora TaxID=2633591 RepID=UPI0037C5F23A